jgi:hypothetical protein
VISFESLLPSCHVKIRPEILVVANGTMGVPCVGDRIDSEALPKLESRGGSQALDPLGP